jgi:hypothetical protein
MAFSRRPITRLCRGRTAEQVSAFSPQGLVDAGLLQFWYDADDGLTNKGAFGANANLLDDTGGCAITPSLLNGHACYSPLAGSGGYLRTGLLTAAMFGSGPGTLGGIHGPAQMIVVGRFGGAPTVNLVMVGSGAALLYTDADQTGYFAGGTLQSAAGTSPLSFQIHDAFHHAKNSRYGVNGVYTSGTNTTPSNSRMVVSSPSAGNRIAIGGNSAGSSRSTCDVACVMIFSNRVPYAQYVQLIDWLNTRYGLSSAKAASYSQPEDVVLSLPAVNGKVAIPIFGQSNASNYGTVAPAGAEWGANTWIFTNEETLIAGANPWDSVTRQTDTISLEAAGATYGWAGRLAALAAARYGLDVYMVPCALASSSASEWSKKAVNGRFRSTLYGSALWRTAQMLANGAFIPYGVVMHGETEAQGTQAQRDGWVAYWQAFAANFRADLLAMFPSLTYLATLEFRFVNVRNLGMTGGYANMHDVIIPSIASPTMKVVDSPLGGPFEVDGIHFQGAAFDSIAVALDAA